jgi:hypothetical protein
MKRSIALAIMGGTISTHAINASLYKNLPYVVKKSDAKAD